MDGKLHLTKQVQNFRDFPKPQLCTERVDSDLRTLPQTSRDTHNVCQAQKNLLTIYLTEGVGKRCEISNLQVTRRWILQLTTPTIRPKCRANAVDIKLRFKVKNTMVADMMMIQFVRSLSTTQQQRKNNENPRFRKQRSPWKQHRWR